MRLRDDSGAIRYDFMATDRWRPVGTQAHEGAPIEGGERMMRPFQLAYRGDSGQRIATTGELRQGLTDATAAINRTHQPNFVWLEHYWEGEWPKRTLVYGGQAQFSGGVFGGIDVFATNGGEMTLVLETAPFWEAITPAVLSATLNEAGGAMELPPLGNLPGRIARLALGPVSGSSATVTQMAIGLRDRHAGTADFFGRIDDAFTYSFPTVGDEHIMRTVDLSAEFSGRDMRHFQGRYRVYARMRLQAGSLARVGIGVYGDGAPFYPTRQPMVYVAGGGSAVEDKFVMLGEIDLPHSGVTFESAADYVARTNFFLYGELLDGVAGTSQISFEWLTLVPSERHIYGEDFYVTTDFGGGVYRAQHVDVLPTGVAVAYSIDEAQNVIYRPSEPQMDAALWQYPRGGGLLVIANPVRAERMVTATMTVYPRYDVYAEAGA